MATNSYFQQGYSGEQELYESLIMESIGIYGKDVFYLPRTVVSKIDILNEPSQSRFDSYYEIEMYIESVDGFGGENNLFSKFGIEIRDQVNLIVSRRRFENQIGWETDRSRPYEGDLIYVPVSKSLFEIKFVEHEVPFYQLDQLPVYKLQCELFEYSGENFETGLYEIDRVEFTYGSGGIQLEVGLLSSDLPTIGEYFTQDFDDDSYARGRIYSIERKNTAELAVDSDELLITPDGFVYFLNEVPDNTPYIITLGQIKGTFREDSNFLLVGNSSGSEFEINKIYTTDNSEINQDSFPQDKQAQNVDIENTADDIIDFTENNPFGDF